MELFNRIKKIAKNFTGSDKALAEKLGFKQATFSGYLNEKRQDNLWPILPKILELFPTIQRDWLYFGEGPMLKSDAHQIEPSSQFLVQADDTALQQALDRIEELENQLEVHKERIADLKERLADKEKLVTLLEENKRLSESTKDTATQVTLRDKIQSATSGRPASGV